MRIYIFILYTCLISVLFNLLSINVNAETKTMISISHFAYRRFNKKLPIKMNPKNSYFMSRLLSLFANAVDWMT